MGLSKTQRHRFFVSSDDLSATLAMGKKRTKNQKKGGAAVSMDISAAEGEQSAAPQAMDTSEGGNPSSNPSISIALRKIKKGTETRRTKSRRKLKAVARAISMNEKSEEKVTKNKTKKLRVQSAKLLYD